MIHLADIRIGANQCVDWCRSSARIYLGPLAVGLLLTPVSLVSLRVTLAGGALGRVGRGGAYPAVGAHSPSRLLPVRVGLLKYVLGHSAGQRQAVDLQQRCVAWRRFAGQVDGCEVALCLAA